MDIEPPTVAIQAITWWEAVLAGVKLEQLQDFGLGVLLLVDVCCYSQYQVRCMHMMYSYLVSTAVNCGSLTNPANGRVSHSGGTTFRKTATYSCNRGYNLVGSSTRTCQSTRRWSGSTPTCSRTCVVIL